jgi:ferrochelatase
MNDSTMTPAAADTGTAAQPAPAGDRIGVLLVNLGTPDAADAESVRRYLKQFLSDPRVIEKDSLAWRIVFKGFILPFRPKRKAKDYQKIWNHENNESPIKTITRGQAEKLASVLASLDQRVTVDWAMRYGNPSTPSRLAALAAQGCDRILLVPLYPQYSAATTATACDAAFRTLMRMRRQPALRVAPPYYGDPVYIDALVSSLRNHIDKLSFQPEVVIASFHGMPREYVAKGDPYEEHCTTTARLMRERLGFSDEKFMLTFQSRFGRAEWLTPYTDKTVKALAKKGVKNLVVITPGFSADCLETLEEIAVENAEIFHRYGGENFSAVPCLNDGEQGMQVIRNLVMRELRGWA